MTDEVDGLCISLAGLLAAIREQEETLAMRRATAYAECREALAPLLPALSKKHGDEWFQFLFWELPHEMPTDLASLFGRHRNTYKLRAIGSGINCSDCSTEIMAKIRSDLAAIQQERTPLCPACKAIKAGDRSAARQREKEANLQRQRELHSMPYRDYLKTPEWSARRKSAFRRAHYRCQLCNISGVRLNVHHRTYENKGQERPEDLTVLCEQCHIEHHNRHSATHGRV